MIDIYAPHLTNIRINEFTSQQQFLDDLKLTYITPVFRKEASTILKD